MNTMEELQTDPQRGLCVIVGGITVLIGFLFLAFPTTMLGWLGAGDPDPAPYLFGVIGALLLLFGGLLIDASRRPDPPPVVLFWATIEKAAFCIAMLIGVFTDVFGWLAIVLVIIEAASALVIWALWRREASRQGP